MLIVATFLITVGSIHTIGVKTKEDSIESDDRESYKMRRDYHITNAVKKERPTLCPANWEGNVSHPLSSSNYYRCQNGVAIISKCDDGLVFDPLSLECCKSSFDGLAGSAIISSGMCRKQLDGLYPIYTEQCHRYYRCQGGSNVSVSSCPPAQAFSFNHQTCLSQQQVSCVRPVCQPEDNNFFWLPGTFCRAYYYCDSSQPLYFTCPEGQVFSRETKDCVQGGECYEPICTGKTDGNHPDTTHSCQRSLQCFAGLLNSVTSCIPGNKSHKVYEGTCFTTPVKHCPTPDTTAVSVETIRDDCQGYSDGPHVIQGTGCRRYQFCEDGKALARMVCPVGLRFNGRNCAPQDTTICEDPCSGKPDGYHADENEGCRKYHFCRSGETTERLSCPQGSLFSGHMCLPAPLVACEEKPAPPVNPCIGLPDGFHADYLHGCNTYYYCASYTSVLQTACPKDLIWNGKECVHGTESLCERPTPHSYCHGLRTGLYQDLASNCSRYSYCHNGNRTLLACPKGKIFDGESCVDSEEYTCPSQEPGTCYQKMDGYRTDKESGCRSYYYCLNDKKVTYVCPGSNLFNGTSCVSPKQFNCPYKSDICTGKKDGYYADVTTNCRKYFYCRKENKLTAFNCGIKKAFDGEQCIVAPNSTEICQRLKLKGSK